MFRKSNSVEDHQRRATKKERAIKNQQKYGKITSTHVRLCSHKKGQVVVQRTSNNGAKFQVERGNCGRVFIVGKK